MSFFSGAAANAPWWGQVAHTKTPQWGLQSVQMSHPPGQHLLHFPVNELQMPYLTVQYITRQKNILPVFSNIHLTVMVLQISLTL